MQAKRQVGSNIKPFIYSAALEKGYTLASILNDAPINQWVDSKWFDIEHINGDLHRISAKQAFKDMPANTAFAVQFYSQESQITRSEFLPNFILAAPGLDSKVIASTKTSVDNETQLELQPYLQPFTTDAQLQVSDDDETPWMGANYLYDSYTKPTFK